MKVNFPIADGTELYFIVCEGDDKFSVVKSKEWRWKEVNGTYLLQRIKVIRYAERHIFEERALSSHMLNHTVFTNEKPANFIVDKMNERLGLSISFYCPFCKTTIEFNGVDKVDNAIKTDHSAFFDCPVCSERFRINFDELNRYNSEKATVLNTIDLQLKK